MMSLNNSTIAKASMETPTCMQWHGNALIKFIIAMNTHNILLLTVNSICFSNIFPIQLWCDNLQREKGRKNIKYCGKIASLVRFFVKYVTF